MLVRILPLAAYAAVLCATPAPAFSQQQTAQDRGPRGYLEYFATGASRTAPGDAGFGARLLLRVPSSAPVLDRMAVGAYLAKIPGEPGTGRREYGVHTEWVAAPRMGGIDPVLTLGLGAVRREGAWTWRVAARPLRVPTPESATALSVAPGVGARVHVAPGVAFRGDLRRSLALDERGMNATEVAAGISLAL
jgi:hypothetical protein